MHAQSGLSVQACGDCHRLNFGAFATPERRVIVNININDLDESLPAPWQWDVNRLTASFVVACRDNGFSEDTARDAVLACLRSNREHMAEYSTLRALVGLMAAFLGIVVFLIVTNDQPFKGDTSVSSESYRLLLDTLKRVHGAVAVA